MNNPPPSHPESRISKKHGKSKTVARRIFPKIFLTVVILMLLASWAGYQTASRNLSQSLSALPKFKAVSQASTMSAILEDISTKLFQISTKELQYTPEYFREIIGFVFRDQGKLIQEIGIKLPDNKGFVLFRDNGEFVELSHEVASNGTYAPFQQLLTFNMTLNKISLFPVVHYTPQSVGGGSLPTGAAIMRMALPLEDDSILILGINLKTWSDQLVPAALQGVGEDHAILGDSDPTAEKLGNENLRAGNQVSGNQVSGNQVSGVQGSGNQGLGSQTHGGPSEGIQLSYFFDNAGWILAERSNLPATEWSPNVARRGFGGDFGRPGYDAAFRPWVQHEEYWRMVTDIHEGRTGAIRESASGFSQAFKHSFGFLCYAPVVFSPSEGSPPAPIGGIAFFETAPNIFGASLETIGTYATILAISLALFAFIIIRSGRHVASPFVKTTADLNTMLEQRDLHYLTRDYASAEHSALAKAINTLITLTKGQAEQLAIVTEVVQQTHAPLPIDIDRSISSAILAGEFGLVGSSEQISHVREDIHKAAQAGTDVLVWGETGTGKELVASAIHKASPRKNGPYISINCGALDENLLMDTLFGHVAGAFSDAQEDRKGAFLAANGGTLHLDELGNASPKVQQSLLRALSVRHIRPLGSDKEIPFDTRVIAATNVDLRQCVNEGTFRQDLYYRLAIISIHIPPLRERKEDIPELAAFYIMESCRRLKKDIIYLSRGGLKALTDHSWPGNVREFANCLTRAVAFAEGDLILPEHIDFEQDPKHLGKGGKRPASGKQPGSSSSVDYLWPAPARGNFTPAKGHGSPQGLAPTTPVQTIPAGVPYAPGSQEHHPGTAEQPFVADTPVPGLGSSGLHSSSGLHGPSDVHGSPEFSGGARRDGSRDVSSTPDLPSSPGSHSLHTLHGSSPHVSTHSSAVPYPPMAESSRSGAMGAGRAKEVKVTGGMAPEVPGYIFSSSLTPQILSFYKQLMENGTINERQLEALTLAHCREQFTRAEYETMSGTNVSSRTIQNDLRELVDLGLLIKSGNGPSTCYEKAEIPQLVSVTHK